MSYVDVVKQWQLVISFWRATCYFGYRSGCLGWGSYKNFLTNKLIRCKPVLILEASFGEKGWQVEALPPII